MCFISFQNSFIQSQKLGLNNQLYVTNILVVRRVEDKWNMVDGWIVATWRHNFLMLLHSKKNK